jgi:hypothetical protein
MACPGMPQLLASTNVEYKVGIPAATGTLIHEMVETLLKGRLNNLTLEEYYLDTTHHVEDFDITVDQDMIDCANDYVDYIDQRVQDLDIKRPLIEEKVSLERYINDDCEVLMTIVQPRGWHQEGTIRTYSISALNLLHWGDTVLKPAANACFEEIPTYNYSKDGCRWCNAKDVCDTYKHNKKGE